MLKEIFKKLIRLMTSISKVNCKRSYLELKACNISFNFSLGKKVTQIKIQ